MGGNYTEYVEDPFGENDQELLRYDVRKTMITILIYIEIITFILRVILCLCAIVVDILLIYVILKFKRLRSTVNSYIKNYAIVNMLLSVSIPITYIGLVYTHNRWEIQIELSILSLNFLFAFALGFDWLIMTFKPEYGMKIKNCYKYLTPSIYILGCVKFLIECTLGLTQGIHIEKLFVAIIYVLILLFILVLDYLNFRYKSSIRSTKAVYSLTIANIIVLCWLPMFIYHICFQKSRYDHIPAMIFRYMGFIPHWATSSVSLIILIVLVRMNKNYRMAFAKMFKRSVRDYSNEGENLDESEDEVTHTQVDSNVFYHNTTTCVKI